MLQVEIGGGFVEQEYRCLLGERARQQHALPLTTRKRVELPCFELAGIGAFHRSSRDLSVTRSLEFETSEVRIPAHQDGLQRSERVLCIVLRHECYPSRPFARRHRAKKCAAKTYLPCVRLQQPRHHT